MGDIFGVVESSSFANALADSEGIKVVQEKENITPYSRQDGSIVIGTPSIYNHDEYIGSLHREISKQTKDMSFFYDVDTGEDEFKGLTKSILQAQRTEYHMHDEYHGRDRILREQYERDLNKGGGLQQVLEIVSRDNPTAAAMLYIGNEMRNDWQGYQHTEMPPVIESEVKRLQPMLEEEWLKLDDKASLERLLERIQYEEQETQNDQGDGEESDGEPGDGQEGEGSPGGTGGTSDQGGQGGEKSEDSEEGSFPSDGDKRGDESEDQDDGQERQGEPEGDQLPEDSSGATEGQGGEADGHAEQGESKDSISDNHHGACDASTSLKDIGLIKDAVNDHEYVKSNDVPYTPSDDLSRRDLTTGSHDTSKYTHKITDMLGTFRLSKKIRKYLISLSQTGYQYGMTRGKVCSKNIYRIFTAQRQPRIFKQKNSTRIKQDTAIFILGDCSGSMRNSRYTVSSACQISISETLQVLRISHMMMQFSTDNYTNRVHYIMKRFDEQFVSRDKLIERYGSHHIEMGCNADGEAVTEAAQLLAKRPEANKILIVLSDGAPAYGYGNSHQFLVDTVRGIEESKVMSIIGIGIQTSSVETYYKDSKVVNQLDELEGVLLGLLKDKVLGG